MYLNILNDNTDEYCINKVIEEGYSFNWICFYKDYTFNRIPTRLIVKWQQPQYSLQTEYIFAIKVEGNYYPVILDNNEFKCISKLIII